MRFKIFAANIFIILFAFCFSVYQKEDLLRNGKSIYIKLLPKDPRSLMQGDYMILRYRLKIKDQSNEKESGYIKYNLDEKNIVEFLNFTDEFKNNSNLIKYKKRGYSIHIGAESFFFQEGHAKYYEEARYAELKIDPNSGKTLVKSLLDKDLKTIIPE